MVILIFIVTAIIVFLYTYINNSSKSKNKFLYAMTLSSLSVLVINIVFYYTLFNDYIKYVLMIFFLISSATFLVMNKNNDLANHQKDILSGLLYNSLLIAMVFNSVIVLVIKYATEINFVLQLLIIAMVTILYFFLQIVYKKIIYYQKPNIGVLIIFVIGFIALFGERSLPQVSSTIISDNRNAVITNTVAKKEEITELYVTNQSELKSICVDKNYVYYVIANDDTHSSLNVYNEITKTDKELMNTQKSDDYAFADMNLLTFEDSLYLVDQLGLYYLNDGNITSLYTFSIENDQKPYVDFYGVLYKKKINNDDILIFETQDSKFVVQKDKLIDYSSLYSDQGVNNIPNDLQNATLLFKISINLELYSYYIDNVNTYIVKDGIIIHTFPYIIEPKDYFSSIVLYNDNKYSIDNSLVVRYDDKTYQIIPNTLFVDKKAYDFIPEKTQTYFTLTFMDGNKISFGNEPVYLTSFDKQSQIINIDKQKNQDDYKVVISRLVPATNTLNSTLFMGIKNTAFLISFIFMIQLIDIRKIKKR